MSAAPRLSVGVPVYNGERFLAEALASILSQDFADFEVLVSDNASTDGTEAMVRELASRDSRVHYVRQPQNLGAAGNYDFTFHESRGELFKWCAHDDLCGPGFFSSCIAALDGAGPGAVAAFPRMRHIDESGRTLRDVDDDPPWSARSPQGRLEELLRDPRRSLLHTCIPVMGVIRRSALRGTGLIGSFPSSDKALICELALRGDLIALPDFLFLRRLHPGISLRANQSDAQVAAWFDPRRGNRFPMPRTALLRALARGVSRAPLPLGERLRCRAVLARHFARSEWRAVGGEFKIAFRERILGRPFVAPPPTGPPRS